MIHVVLTVSIQFYPKQASDINLCSDKKRFSLEVSHLSFSIQSYSELRRLQFNIGCWCKFLGVPDGDGRRDEAPTIIVEPPVRILNVS
jgi:hypothetical protein